MNFLFFSCLNSILIVPFLQTILVKAFPFLVICEEILCLFVCFFWPIFLILNYFSHFISLFLNIPPPLHT
ncbi:unnamed protein product [Meloidogyne enterolobii]|uniref:Uncharacterized protein n=1 Tax=Meloidogyne enterolobii TaxID=390850 RepID=A0ACB0Z1I5_MELEN